MISLQILKPELDQGLSRYPHLISNREQEVLELISFGYCSKEIANSLHISTHTVISHCKNLKNKLGARNVASLVRIGCKRGLI